MKFIRVYQTENFAPLYLETLRLVTSDIVSKVQEFDSANAELTAEAIMSQAQAQLSRSTMAEDAELNIDEESLGDDTEVKAVEAGELEL